MSLDYYHSNLGNHLTDISQYLRFSGFKERQVVVDGRLENT